MNTGWQEISLGDFIELKRGYDLPKKNRKHGSIPLVSSAGISDTHDTFKVKGPGVITGRYGTIGEVFYVEDDFWPLNTTLYVTDFKANNPLFVYYFLKTINYSEYSDKAAVPGVNRNHLHKARIKVPNDLAVQEKIARILKSFDDKITLNRQINQTLEAMAQALFKSWFVDFEPVKAKLSALAAGGSADDANLAAMSAISGKTTEQLLTLKTTHPDQFQQLYTTADLFPSEMVDSELGEIPKGWEVKSLDQIAHYQNGLALQKFRPENENDFLPVVKIAELKKGCADGEEKASPNIKPECIIDNGDVVFSWSGSLLVDIWCGGKAALNQHLFKVTSQSYPKWFFHQFTLHHLENFQRIAQAKAVTMGHIKREHLEQALCAVPSNHFIEAVNQYFEPTLNKAIECRLENNTLTTLRNSLLPKLLTGELLNEI